LIYNFNKKMDPGYIHYIPVPPYYPNPYLQQQSQPPAPPPPPPSQTAQPLAKPNFGNATVMIPMVTPPPLPQQPPPPLHLYHLNHHLLHPLHLHK